MTQADSTLLEDLHGATARGEIVAFYQPQFDVASGRLVAAEALARWAHPRQGMVPPNDFIPLAEESGLIHELGDYMIREACAAAYDWHERGHTIEVAVNVSATQLHEPRFADQLLETIESFNLDPRLLTVEVTESTAIIDVSTVAERLDWLRSVGVTISVDDFGAGHSSVEQVLGLRATELKIDQALVRDDGDAARTLLGAVVGFAHDKGLRVVAEGIENDAQLERVRELRCDRAQGYLLGQPVPKAELDAVLVSQRG